MHCAKLNLLATVLVSNRDIMVDIDLERMALIAQQYWTVSRNRVARWNEELAAALRKQKSNQLRDEVEIQFAVQLLEEVLVSQLYTRIWGGLLAYYDLQQGLGDEDRLSGLGQSIVSCHEDACNRALELLQLLQEAGSTRAEVVNRLRRRIERWTDMLLAQMSKNIDLTAYSFDKNRMRDIVAVNSQTTDSPTVNMLVSGIQAAQIETFESGYTPKMNHKLASMSLSCLPNEAWSEADLHFDTSVMRSGQIAWEIERLVERAIFTEYSTLSVQPLTNPD